MKSKNTQKNSKENLEQQLLLIEKLAKRLPWIVLGISLFAFIVIFIQVLFFGQNGH